MKNRLYKSLGGLALAAALLIACKKRLTEYNPSGTTAETVYTTAPGYDALINGAYSFTKWWYGKEEGVGMSEMGTDIWTAAEQTYVAASGVSLDNKGLVLYQNLNPVNLNVTRMWKKLYAAVNLCNTGIKIAQEGAFTPTPAQLGELRFLRAFYNWHIVETWGGVHLTTVPTTEANLTAYKTPVADFYKLIIEDLEYAEGVLPATSSVYGKVNKKVAQAFLARVYLTWAYKDPSFFAKARDKADQVATPGDLKNNYADLWRMTSQKNNPTEIIWSVNYTDPTVVTDVYDKDKNPNGYGDDIFSANGNPTNNRGNNNLHTLFVPRYDAAWPFFNSTAPLKRDVRNGWPFCRFKPTRHLLELFDETKDARYKGTFQTVFYVNQVVTSGILAGKRLYKDTAFVVTKNPKPSTNYYTVDALKTYNADGSTIGTISNENAAIFPTLIKFLDSTRSASPNDAGSGNIQSVKDVYVIRTAEMYLIAAEASVMMGELGTARTWVNDLRRTRAIAGQSLEITDDAQMTLDFVLDERAREFAGELIRWFDLKRTGKLIDRVQKHNPDAAVFIRDFHTLRPIPQQQIDAIINKSEFTQNFGY